MKKIMLFLLLFLSCTSCGLWKKKALQSSSVEQQVHQYRMDSMTLQQLVKDSIVWEQEQWRNILFFEDSLHPPILVQEHVKNRASKRGSQLTQQQSHQVLKQQFQLREKELVELPKKSWKGWWKLGMLCLILVFCYFYFRRWIRF